MSARELYEAVLIELNKENAPNILLEDFNYFANKAVYQYINKRYNIYDINQQTTDDIRVLKSTAMLDPKHTPYNIDGGISFMGATYTVELPSDYFHILNCICFYSVKKPFKCYNAGDTWRAAATRLTADAWSQVMDNYWNRPTYKRPYYYIHNQNQLAPKTNNDTGEVIDYYTKNDAPTNPYNKEIINKSNKNDEISNAGTDSEKSLNSKEKDNDVTIGGTQTDPFKEIKINGFYEENNGAQYPLKRSQVRYGNASKVLMEIRYGEDNTEFELVKVMVDYIKAPQHIRLTQYQIDKTLDESQILEFPDYVCQEIVNELVHIIMENISDQRLQTHPVVSQSIANPTQQQTEQQ